MDSDSSSPKKIIGFLMDKCPICHNNSLGITIAVGRPHFLICKYCEKRIAILKIKWFRELKDKQVCSSTSIPKQV